MRTITRKSGIVDATWDEINFKNAEWTIPAERMKASRQEAGRPHIVDLSNQVVNLFIQVKANIIRIAIRFTKFWAIKIRKYL